MDKNIEFGKVYCDKMTDLQKKNYIRKLTKTEAEETVTKTWYLPHFGVFNPNKPNKLRIVFDASAKSYGISLNDCLLTGPDLYNSLHTILLNFRVKKFAFTADIKEMFLQVNVRKEDRAAQRILYRGMDREQEPDVYEINVVFFGSTSGPCLAQEAKNRNARDFMEKYPQAAKAIISQHYMDDYLGGADTEAEAKQLIHDIIYIHKEGGFILCNWIANTSSILQDMDKSLLADCHKSLENNVDTSAERILGVWWDPEKDVFCFKTKFNKIDKDILTNTRRPTKKEVLKVVMSIFDPLGFLANFIILGRVLLQDIWRSQIGWDDELTSTLDVKWQNWIKDLQNIPKFNIPRQYCTMNRERCVIELHIFCDASENAFASVAYLRWQEEDKVTISFLNAKTRVSPLKPMSIPRLKLQAALLGARLGDSLKHNLELKISRIFYWTDSKTVLCWIHSEARRFKVFVAQRLGEIQELTNTNEWRYVGSKENVADEATKGYREIDFSSTSRWINGPSFLLKSPDSWPKQIIDKPTETERDAEVRTEFVFVTFIKECLVTPEPGRFSKWQRLLRATAWMIRFTDNSKSKVKRVGELDIFEIKKAENLLLRRAQLEAFAEEVSMLKRCETLQPSSRLYVLDCELNEGLIRLGGRLNNAVQISVDFKKPIILEPKHKITKLIIQYYHEQVNHHGQETVVNNLRQKFWILRMRQAVRSCWANCQKCKNRKSSHKVPVMGQLPLSRLEPTIRPFIKTGVDYFGPIEITVKRSHEKRYGVIFTCMVTRAVHLELAHDLSTDAFIHVFRQFGCRRGFPEEIYSDNGLNFKGANRELSENILNLNEPEILQFCSLKGVKWCFNPPLAPHMGGIWERLIQSFKKNLTEILKTKYPQEYVLRTIFVEIENILNSRPLTHVPIDPHDPEALTPNHFLIGPSYAALPCAKTHEKDMNLLNKWKAAQKLTDIFWQRWSKEYLTSIIRRSKWHKEQEPIKIGDIVLLADPNGPRNSWPKGKVTKLYPAKDGRVRVVDIITANGSELRRPVSRLCILEVRQVIEE